MRNVYRSTVSGGRLPEVDNRKPTTGNRQPLSNNRSYGRPSFKDRTGMTESEIAALCGMSVPAVKSTLRRALGKIRQRREELATMQAIADDLSLARDGRLAGKPFA